MPPPAGWMTAKIMANLRRKGFYAFCLLMAMVMTAMGIWQLQRLQWKQNLIAASQKAITAKPITINDITAGIEHGYDVDWLRVRLTGTYRHDLERYIYKPGKAGLGYQVLTPFIEDSGFIVFVDRGWITAKAKQLRPAPGARGPQGMVTVTGISRLHNPGLKLFLADADVKNNIWYWYDRETLAASLPAGLGEKADGSLPIISPVFMQLEPGGEPKTQNAPRVPPIKVDLPNHHQQYAITWFALALVMLVMLFVFYRSQKAKTQRRNDP